MRISEERHLDFPGVEMRVETILNPRVHTNQGYEEGWYYRTYFKHNAFLGGGPYRTERGALTAGVEALLGEIKAGMVSFGPARIGYDRGQS